MAYDETLAERLRDAMADLPKIEEKKMMGGLVMMVNGKMCVGILKDELMCRIHPDEHDKAVELHGCRTMDFTKQKMRGWVMVDQSATRTPAELLYWVNLALAYNKTAKSAKTKKKSR